MQRVDYYNTVSQSAQIELVINKSRFIGSCYPVKSEEEAQCLLEAARKKYWDATHNCYAYVIGESSEIARFSDDGEPGGTAGMPMMEVLKQRELTYVLVIATRYFGGILLGAGGLVRAYSKTTAQAADAALPVMMMRTALYAMEIDYTLWGRMENYLRSAQFPLYAIEFAECVRATALVPPREAKRFFTEIADLSDGRIQPEKVGEDYQPWKMTFDPKA